MRRIASALFLPCVAPGPGSRSPRLVPAFRASRAGGPPHSARGPADLGRRARPGLGRNTTVTLSARPRPGPSCIWWALWPPRGACRGGRCRVAARGGLVASGLPRLCRGRARARGANGRPANRCRLRGHGDGGGSRHRPSVRRGADPRRRVRTSNVPTSTPRRRRAHDEATVAFMRSRAPELPALTFEGAPIEVEGGFLGRGRLDGEGS